MTSPCSGDLTLRQRAERMASGIGVSTQEQRELGAELLARLDVTAAPWFEEFIAEAESRPSPGSDVAIPQSLIEALIEAPADAAERAVITDDALAALEAAAHAASPAGPGYERFLSACDPAAILGLIARVRTAETRLGIALEHIAILERKS